MQPYNEKMLIFANLKKNIKWLYGLSVRCVTKEWPKTAW